jgi:hypothetical protein
VDTIATAGWSGLVSLAGVSAGGDVDVTVHITQVLAAATSSVVSAGRVVGRIPSLPQHFVFREQFAELAERVGGRG